VQGAPLSRICARKRMIKVWTDGTEAGLLDRSGEHNYYKYEQHLADDLGKGLVNSMNCQ
jgi:hypothetical protein